MRQVSLKWHIVLFYVLLGFIPMVAISYFAVVSYSRSINTLTDDYVSQLAARDVPAERFVIRGDADPALFVRLARRLRTLRPDIAHTHLIHADLHGIPAARLARVPVVITSRHNDNAFRRKTPIKQVNAALWRMADAGIAISDHIARFVTGVEGAPAGKC